MNTQATKNSEGRDATSNESASEKEQGVGGILIGGVLGVVASAATLLGIGRPAVAMWVAIFGIALMIVGPGLVGYMNQQ